MDAPVIQDVLHDRATIIQTGAYVVAASFDRAGDTAAFALGDGTLRLLPRFTQDWRTLNIHRGGILSLAADCTSRGFLTGGDDGQLLRIHADDTTAILGSYGRIWVEQITTTMQSGGLIACTAGKSVHVLKANGETRRILEHKSTATGVAFDSKGKRLAVSHYNGASLWFVNASSGPKLLEWKGSHTGVAIHPNGDAVVTAMQENALHGWRLADGQHMRMSGYPSKTESLSFTKNGRYLATSGADAVVLWPFFGGGPMGKPPLERADRPGTICTRVAAHPNMEMVAAGFADGSVVLSDIGSEKLIIIAAPDNQRGPISALAWSPEGGLLLVGAEHGFAAMVRLD